MSKFEITDKNEIDNKHICETPFPISNTDLVKFRGLTYESNWIIINKVLCGAFPGGYDDRVHCAYISTLLRQGIGTFVCLCNEFNPIVDIPKENYINGLSLRPYFPTVEFIYNNVNIWNKETYIKPKLIDYIYFPLYTGKAYANTKTLYNFILDLINRINNNEILYIHSYYGSNRAIFISTILLMIYKNYNPEDSINITEMYYCKRKIMLQHSPLLSEEQKKQIVEIFNIHINSFIK